MIVSLEEVKAHLNVTFGADDDLIVAKIEAAEAHVENAIGYKFSTLTEGVPPPLKEAVKLYTAHLYENREATIVGVTAMPAPGFNDIINSYRDWSF